VQGFERKCSGKKLLSRGGSFVHCGPVGKMEGRETRRRNNIK
jgi:hypothetical protein